MYNVQRRYMSYPDKTITLLTNVTLERAQQHCNDPEHSSATCTHEAGRNRTRKFGAWFDTFTKQ